MENNYNVYKNSTSDDNLIDYIMPDSNKINRVVFSTHFISFCKQSVKGSIMGIFRFYSDEGTFKNKQREEVRNILRNGNFVLENNVNYLNSCWKNYFNKSDDFILQKFNFMMKFGNFKHESCLFNYIWDFSQFLLSYLLARIDENEMRDTDFLSQSTDIILDAILSFHVDNILKIENICDEQCKVYIYKKGEDFIKVEKTI